jgi:hypothetical protein
VKLTFDDLSKKREQNLEVFASNWRSGNLAFVFIEEVGEWNPLVFALFLKVCQNRFFI